MSRVAEILIRCYQRYVSPALPRRCKYEPTCSAYAIEALRSYGFVRGSVLAGWRLVRCNPFSHGGYDPVVGQRLFGGSRLSNQADVGRWDAARGKPSLSERVGGTRVRGTPS